MYMWMHVWFGRTPHTTAQPTVFKSDFVACSLGRGVEVCNAAAFQPAERARNELLGFHQLDAHGLEPDPSLLLAQLRKWPQSVQVFVAIYLVRASATRVCRSVVVLGEEFGAAVFESLER